MAALRFSFSFMVAFMVAVAVAIAHCSTSTTSVTAFLVNRPIGTPWNSRTHSSSVQRVAFTFAAVALEGAEDLTNSNNSNSNSVTNSITNSNTNSNDENNKTGDGDFSFFDEARIYVRAGSGGQGSSTYKKAKKGANGIPDGGTGGSGGNVLLRLDGSLNTLAGLGLKSLRPNAFGGGGAAASSKRSGNSASQQQQAPRLLSFRATDGTAGGRMYDNGRTGADCEVLVPPGTVVQREVDPDLSNDHKGIVELGTISHENPELVVARGGNGGEGTAVLKGKKKGASRRGPQGGDRSTLKLTLKIVADIALVGVPNAGKSTFLASVTRAKPRIADYPFTTVVPNLGTWIPEPNNNNNNSNNSKQQQQKAAGGAASNGLVLCDVPGLIEGASEGVGLGHAFLRHIERCRVILHLLDATSDDPVRDYAMVNSELNKYGGSLSEKPQVVVINKIDASHAFCGGDSTTGSSSFEEQKEALASLMKDEMGHTRLLWVSAKERRGVDDLMSRMSSYVGGMKTTEEDEKKKQRADQASTVVPTND